MICMLILSLAAYTAAIACQRSQREQWMSERARMNPNLRNR